LSKTVLKGNRAINYLEAGKSNNQTIVLLHGLGNRSTTWEEQLSKLSSHFHVIAWDAPGYGDSFDPSPVYKDFSEFSDTLKEFVESLDLSNFYLVGHSMGAAIAIDFSYRFPDKVQKLILADPTRGSAFISEEKSYQQLEDRLYAINEQGSYKLAQDRAKNLFSDYATTQQIEKSEKIMAQVRPSGYSSASYSLYNLNQKNIYPLITVPTMIICGEEDKITPVPESKYIYNHISNSELVTIPKAGHLCFLEAPKKFSDYVINFFAKAGRV